MTTPPNLITRRWTRKSGEVRCCYYYRKGRAEGRALIKLGSDYALSGVDQGADADSPAAEMILIRASTKPFLVLDFLW